MREKIAQITYDGMAWGSHLLQADEILALIIKEIDAVENPYPDDIFVGDMDTLKKIIPDAHEFSVAAGIFGRMFFEKSKLAIKEWLNG